VEAPDRRHVWHLFVVLHPERERIRRELEARGIHSGLHYPVPVHLQRAYGLLGHRPGDFPASERVARECLTLPLFPEMTVAQQDRVVEALRAILREVG
jgi:dTDP-4-amino-4,6-dideoxygalactose transaminase